MPLSQRSRRTEKWARQNFGAGWYTIMLFDVAWNQRVAEVRATLLTCEAFIFSYSANTVDKVELLCRLYEHVNVRNTYLPSWRIDSDNVLMGFVHYWFASSWICRMDAHCPFGVAPVGIFTTPHAKTAQPPCSPQPHFSFFPSPFGIGHQRKEISKWYHTEKHEIQQIHRKMLRTKCTTSGRTTLVFVTPGTSTYQSGTSAKCNRWTKSVEVCAPSDRTFSVADGTVRCGLAQAYSRNFPKRGW